LKRSSIDPSNEWDSTKGKSVGVSVSKGTWTARHGKDKATYAETRFGAAAQQLAERAYLQMVAGSFDKARDDIELRQSYSMKETALLLGMTEGKLYHWVSTGELDGQAVVPPRKDPSRGNKDRFSGCEVILTKERMK